MKLPYEQLISTSSFKIYIVKRNENAFSFNRFNFLFYLSGYIAYFPITDVHLTFPHNAHIIDILHKNNPFIQVNAKLIQVRLPKLEKKAETK